MFENEIQQLSEELAQMLPNVLEKASVILNRDVNMQSVNAIIGGKNRTHAHVWDRTFSCFEEFLAVWLNAMYEDYLSRKDEDEPMDRAGFRNALLLQDPDIMDYAEKFLKRNFLRYYGERTKGRVASQKEVDERRKKADEYKKLFKKIK